MDDPLAFSDPHMSKLGLTLDFGPADLEDNQEGALSPSQVARLETDLRWFYWPMILVAAALALFMGASSAANGTFALVPVVFLMGVAAVPAVLLHFQRQQLPDQPVLHTTLRLGGLSLVARRWNLMDEVGPAQLPVEGGKRVFASRHLYRALQANLTYVAYYAPVRTWSGYRLLSVEPLDTSDRGGSWPAKAKRKGKRG